MFKKLSKATIIINIIALIAILYDILVIFKEGDALYGTAYLFTIYFISIIYAVSFIHLFYYETFKDKLILTVLDLLPIFLFGILVTITQETNISTIAQDITFTALVFYVLGGIVVLLLNYTFHKIYFKLKPAERAIKNETKRPKNKWNY